METEGKSWGDDMVAYASRKRAPLQPSQAPARYGRTPNAPFGDLTHPGYHLEHPVVTPSEADKDRYSRHGWGTTEGGAGSSQYGPDAIRQRFHDPARELAQTAEDARVLAHTGLRAVPGAGPGQGSNRPPLSGPTNPTGRVALFETLQYSRPEAPEKADTWLGNVAYDPRLGRAAPPAPVTRGRTDLFDIMTMQQKRKPGDTSGDAWIGNAQVDPFLGKASVETPANRAGRADLFGTIQQARTTPGDKSLDAWLGHRLIDPAKGKSTGTHNPHVVGQTPLEPVLAHSFLEEKVPHVVTSRARKCEIAEVFSDHPAPLVLANQGRRVLEQRPGKTGRKGLFGILGMDHRELSDITPKGRMYVGAPGQTPGTGRLMLYANGEM